MNSFDLNLRKAYAFRLRFPRWTRRLYDAISGHLPAFVAGQIVGAVEAVVVIAGFFAVVILGCK